MQKHLAAVLVFAMLPVLWAQNSQMDWQSLSQLQSGQKIQLIDANHQKHSGAFSSFTDQAIVLHERGGDQTIQRANVLRVKLQRRSHRLRNVIVAGALGAGVGAGIGYVATPSGKIAFTQGDGAGLGAALGFVGGAVVGAVVPSHKTIYRSTP
jgi:thiamine pyrophosphate-dependent acetolactate synthase large subunit-like protein